MSYSHLEISGKSGASFGTQISLENFMPNRCLIARPLEKYAPFMGSSLRHLTRPAPCPCVAHASS